LHAAGVAREGRGLGLCGFSGMGKSTLALHLMNRGLDYVSNDRLLARREGSGVRMFGVPILPRINPGTALGNERLGSILSPERRKAVAAMPLDELWELEEKYDVFIDEVYGEGRFRLAAPMTALGILNWRRDGTPPRLEEVSLAERPELMPAFMKEPGLFYEPDGEDVEARFSEDAYRRALAGVRVLEISGGVDFERAAAACLEALED
ncbi:MAG: HprK-related kinase B, partial [Candidatus Methylomirabilis sp.]|nr:HprK-related kinase B [Deltaproteobacteria bacterium]